MDIMSVLEALEQARREALFRATEEIHSEAIAGLLFGAGLIITDHLFALARKVVR